LNGVAEVLQTHDEASGVDGFGPLVEVVRADMSRPISARMTQALNSSMPGMVVRRRTVARKGST
jgi:hypothetical protein